MFDRYQSQHVHEHASTTTGSVICVYAYADIEPPAVRTGTTATGSK